MNQKNRPIYLDYMATTPVAPEVITMMQDYLALSGEFGNSSSHHHIYGWKAKDAIELARQQTATLIGAHQKEIIFTSGATESINLAIQGAAYQYSRKGKHIVTCLTEHKAVLDTCRFLETQGFTVTYLPTDSEGLIDLNQLEASLTPQTLMVSIMHVNNEIGVIQPIEAIGKITREKGILFHVDAAQSAGKIPIHVKSMQIDLLSLSGHKMYAPKGIGALFIRQTPRLHLQPLCYGGNQELHLRPGTLPTHQIAGMGEAARLAINQLSEDKKKAFELRQALWNGIKDIPGLLLHGSMKHRVAHNLNVSVEGVHGEALLIGLRKIAISSGSACNSATFQPSHVLQALGKSPAIAQNAIRFSIGRYTTQADIEVTIEHFRKIVNKLRQLSGKK